MLKFYIIYQKKLMIMKNINITLNIHIIEKNVTISIKIFPQILYYMIEKMNLIRIICLYVKAYVLLKVMKIIILYANVT